MNDTQLYDNMNSTMRHADSLVIDLKQHPKRYVHFSVLVKRQVIEANVFKKPPVLK